MVSWALVGILALAVIVMLWKLHTLRTAAREIADAFADRLSTDTNTLIGISCGDRSMRRLADAINGGLRTLRTQRHRFQQGDMALKNAVTNISHDLRTPLTAICGYLDLLEQEPLPENAARYISVIRNRSDMLTRLTEELFRYSVVLSSPESSEKSPTSINAVLEESLAAFYTALSEKGITPDIHMPEHPVIRPLDRSALSRVFSNLLSNVIKYSDGDLSVCLSKNGDIAFSNRASQLDEVQVGKLFDRFYTVEAARNSTGLGLSIARTLVEQMGGTISAAYRDGRLHIRICFP